MKDGINLRSTTTNEIFRVKATANCCTKNVVYILNVISVPSSTSNKRRTHSACDYLPTDLIYTIDERTNHWLNICQPDHSIHDIKIMVVEKIHKNDTDYTDDGRKVIE